MSGFSTILFDFDGTIADTLELLVKVYNEIAPHFNCRKVDMEDVQHLRGKRPQDLLNDYKVTVTKLPLLVTWGRFKMNNKMNEIQPFDSMLNVLNKMKSLGLSLGILTSNSQKNIQGFIRRYKLNDLFDFVYTGKHIFGKAEILRKIMKEHQISHENILYVGDETRDIEAARKVQVKMAAVCWGFNNKEALSKLNPDYIVEQPKSLLSIVENNLIVSS
jgi:phosphoglycolate phosphatase